MPRNKKKWLRDVRNVRVPIDQHTLWRACQKVRAEAMSARDKLVNIILGMPEAGVPMPRVDSQVERIYEAIAVSMPYVVCPDCAAKDVNGGCETCADKGWMSKYEWQYKSDKESE